jgi:hypothetical protein
MTSAQIVAGAIGAGLGTATIFFPITYFAMRNQFALRKDLGKAWRPYLSCVGLFAIIQVLGLEPSVDTPTGLMTFFAIPIFVCALVLYFTYRAPSGSPQE